MIEAGQKTISHQMKVEAEDPRLDAMIDVWSEAQREALYRLPHLPWEQGEGEGRGQED